MEAEEKNWVDATKERPEIARTVEFVTAFDRRYTGLRANGCWYRFKADGGKELINSSAVVRWRYIYYEQNEVAQNNESWDEIRNRFYKEDPYSWSPEQIFNWFKSRLHPTTHCQCKEDDKPGETRIWCCNNCGLPNERWNGEGRTLTDIDLQAMALEKYPEHANSDLETGLTLIYRSVYLSGLRDMMARRGE